MRRVPGHRPYMNCDSVSFRLLDGIEFASKIRPDASDVSVQRHGSISCAQSPNPIPIGIGGICSASVLAQPR